MNSHDAGSSGTNFKYQNVRKELEDEPNNSLSLRLLGGIGQNFTAVFLKKTPKITPPGGQNELDLLFSFNHLNKTE